MSEETLENLRTGIYKTFFARLGEVATGKRLILMEVRRHPQGGINFFVFLLRGKEDIEAGGYS